MVNLRQKPTSTMLHARPCTLELLGGVHLCTPFGHVELQPPLRAALAPGSLRSSMGLAMQALVRAKQGRCSSTETLDDGTVCGSICDRRMPIVVWTNFEKERECYLELRLGATMLPSGTGPSPARSRRRTCIRLRSWCVALPLQRRENAGNYALGRGSSVSLHSKEQFYDPA